MLSSRMISPVRAQAGAIAMIQTNFLNRAEKAPLPHNPCGYSAVSRNYGPRDGTILVIIGSGSKLTRISGLRADQP
jgi:hypothetical protein